MRILKTIQKIPGGMVVVPLLLGATLNTLFPNLAEYFGGVTGAYINGASAILFAFFFCVGASIDIKGNSGYIVKKGLLISGGKVLLAALLGIVLSRIIPSEGIQTGILSGVSTLAIVAAFSQTNGGLYISILEPYGRNEDIAAFPFISVQSGPFFTMIIMGMAGVASFPLPALMSTLLPFILGLILGTLDQDIRQMFAPGVGILIPFFSCALGFTLDFRQIIQSGLSGIIVGLLVIFVSGGVMAFLDRYVAKSDGIAGWAAASTAGAGVSVPHVLAELAPEQFGTIAESATAIVATAVIVTSILTPIVTNYMEKRARVKGLPVVPNETKSK
ncbi:2-keto-3-deoxygluconate permease [Suicoccus acidiformans]|uniref:2-keto-3-deoxygluconate permease n=1 Tax=Suicoccus acidiformans TaxID=2036206 RepID=A0A347WIH2_9LACT|nr:2-keto-3-deoxygluconate permease [Suicoccus acidiformans]AXY24879.1 2-keto-3-deoxygluconate permease [Suicoccus acidiformans]